MRMKKIVLSHSLHGMSLSLYCFFCSTFPGSSQPPTSSLPLTLPLVKPQNVHISFCSECHIFSGYSYLLSWIIFSSKTLQEEKLPCLWTPSCDYMLCIPFEYSRSIQDHQSSNSICNSQGRGTKRTTRKKSLRFDHHLHWVHTVRTGETPDTIAVLFLINILSEGPSARVLQALSLKWDQSLFSIPGYDDRRSTPQSL